MPSLNPGFIIVVYVFLTRNFRMHWKQVFHVSIVLSKRDLRYYCLFFKLRPCPSKLYFPTQKTEVGSLGSSNQQKDQLKHFQ